MSDALLRTTTHWRSLASTLASTALLIVLSGCSTRQVGDHFVGSTAQRLVAHSIERMMTNLPQQDLARLTGKDVYLESYFVNEHVVHQYARERFKIEMQERYHVDWVANSSDANFTVTLFFASLATDSDSFGVSLPVPFVEGNLEVSTIPVFSLEKFHGISEMNVFIRNNHTQQVHRIPTQKARTRTDRLATPFITIPISSRPD